MNDKIRVGLIGYGYASKTFHAPLIMGTPGLELAAVSSSDETKVKADWPAVSVVSEPRHLFNDPHIDLIVIPTPNDTHFPLAKAALEAGKHVVVDKPFTVTLSQARELDALARALVGYFPSSTTDAGTAIFDAEGLAGGWRARRGVLV